MLHIIVSFGIFSDILLWQPPSDIALQCSCGQNSDLVTGLNIRIPRFYPTNAHLQIAMSATSHGSNWWWSLPTGRRPLEPICIRYNAGSIKTCFLLSWAPMQTVHHWLSEKANKSHFYKDIEYGVFSFHCPIDILCQQQRNWSPIWLTDYITYLSVGLIHYFLL